MRKTYHITLIPHAAEIARSHHERYDGKGYPDGLAGTEIPIHARIVAVADCYDAMNSRRIYRNALPPEVVYEEFRKNRGTQFDPEITDIFLKLLNENGCLSGILPRKNRTPITFRICSLPSANSSRT